MLGALTDKYELVRNKNNAVTRLNIENLCLQKSNNTQNGKNCTTINSTQVFSHPKHSENPLLL